MVQQSLRGKHYTRRNGRKKYAQGKRALAICDRTGMQHPYKEMVVEPGTGLLVHKSQTDGRWNLVDHPQNFPADVGEAVGLKNPRPDVEASSVLLTDDNGDVITGDDGLPFFTFNNKNILGVTYVSGA